MNAGKNLAGGYMTQKEGKYWLEKLIKQHGISVWKKWDYIFNFSTNQYFWRGRQITLSFVQAASLYGRLVLNKPPCTTLNPQALQTAQARYGREFLCEIVNKNKVHERAYKHLLSYGDLIK